MSIQIFLTPVSNESVVKLLLKRYKIYRNTEAFWGWKAHRSRVNVRELLIEEVAKLDDTISSSKIWELLHGYVQTLCLYDRAPISPRLCVEQVVCAMNPTGVIGIQLEPNHSLEILHTTKRIIELLAILVYGNDNYTKGITEWEWFYTLLSEKVNSI